eukprot:TRINITY_DN4794_c0_g1_i1.p1 TRINITY_DN4794_c0_g1~~TRINITY_DN4794_c0_g1_i1.p1  ORF type:complete len:462 (-),score=31.47 TRINITY_DN4794_c0_g1_i1:23-1303(-)
MDVISLVIGSIAVFSGLMLDTSPMMIMIFISFVGGYITFKMIPAMTEMFINANLFGIDMSKDTKQKVPESTGVICGVVYLTCVFLFIPFPFMDWFVAQHYNSSFSKDAFPHNRLAEYLSALISICSMILLGFADDVLNLRWRHKLILPTLASIPILMVYYVTYNVTVVLIPNPFQTFMGTSFNLGVLYYVYMGMLAVFCTNAINILAGVNGVEAGQSLVIGFSIAIFNVLQLMGDCCYEEHLFSLFLIIPFLSVTSVLLYYNWYPSQVFVGDTFCYFAGMTFAVVGILGHFGKTLLMFFIPQTINFLYSVPQLFHIVPCPRHRLPKYNPETKLMELSWVELNENGKLAWILVKVLKSVGLARVKEENEKKYVNNLTILNLILLFTGPLKENQLTLALLGVQIVCSILALFIRYPLLWIVQSFEPHV